MAGPNASHCLMRPAILVDPDNDERPLRFRRLRGGRHLLEARRGGHGELSKLLLRWTDVGTSILRASPDASVLAFLHKRLQELGEEDDARDVSYRPLPSLDTEAYCEVSARGRTATAFRYAFALMFKLPGSRTRPVDRSAASTPCISSSCGGSAPSSRPSSPSPSPIRAGHPGHHRQAGDLRSRLITLPGDENSRARSLRPGAQGRVGRHGGRSPYRPLVGWTQDRGWLAPPPVPRFSDLTFFLGRRPLQRPGSRSCCGYRRRTAW